MAMIGEREVQARATATHGPERRPLTEQPAVVGLLGIATVLLAVGVSQDVRVTGALKRVVVFAHLATLVVGLGAVLTINAYGAMWLLGRRGVHEVRRLAQAAHVLVWFGFVGLLATGALLRPDLTMLRAKVKMVMVIVAAANGAWETSLLNRLNDLPPDARASEHRSLLRSALVSGLLSQACWWGATVIGFITTTKRLTGG